MMHRSNGDPIADPAHFNAGLLPAWNRFLAVLTAAIAMTMPLPAFAASGDNPVWNLVMLVVVLLASAASAVLPLSALKHWQGYWKWVAAAPLALLAVWVVWIGLAKMLVPGSHALWLLEIFAWSMLTLLYMATVFTAKRQFERADSEKAHK